MCSRLGPALLLSAAMLAGCEYSAVLIGPPPDAEVRPRTEDEQLADFGDWLEGTWAGSASWLGVFFSPETAEFELKWTPDADGSRSGELIVCAIAVEAPPCASGALYFRYGLHELAEANGANGHLEWVKPEMLPGYIQMQVIPQTDGKLYFQAAGGPFSLSGTFKRLTPPPAADAGPDASFR